MEKEFEKIQKAAVEQMLLKAQRKFAEAGKDFDYQISEPNPVGSTFVVKIVPPPYDEYIFDYITSKIPEVGAETNQPLGQVLKEHLLSIKNISQINLKNHK